MNASLHTHEGVTSHIHMWHIQRQGRPRSARRSTWRSLDTNMLTSHLTHMNASLHWHECVTSHIWTNRVTHMDESIYTWMSHITLVNASPHTYTGDIYNDNVIHAARGAAHEWVMTHTYERATSHMWMHQFTHMHASPHTCEQIVSHIWMSQFKHEWVNLHMNESPHTHECVTSHIHRWHIQRQCHPRRSARRSTWMSHDTHIWTSHLTHIKWCI